MEVNRQHQGRIAANPPDFKMLYALLNQLMDKKVQECGNQDIARRIVLSGEIRTVETLQEKELNQTGNQTGGNDTTRGASPLVKEE
ncbi:hypothetical protein Tco_0331469 [Tanacetum coccineum]